MKFRAYHRIPLFTHNNNGGRLNYLHAQRFHFLRKVQVTQARTSVNSGGSSSSNSSSQGNTLLLPGATVATIVMLGLLHARRLYDDQKVEEAREKGTLEFQPDVKASFMRLLPLRSISRFWGTLTSVELPMWLRPFVYKGWARAFHSNLEEVALPLEEYASLREFFVRRLKEGTRPIDSDPCCLISPVDGTILQFGELKEAGAMIEQVKGFSYSVSSLLGASSLLPMTVVDDNKNQNGAQECSTDDVDQKSWWRVSLASPKVRDPAPACLMKGIFYCVIYLRPGDYHRIHSPADWNVLGRRHFSGRLFPMNERATRTIRNLYVENERLFIDPTLSTNRPWKKLLHPEPPEEQVYEPKGTGVLLKKGDELAAFNMGSTVVMIFQAPISQPSADKSMRTGFRFCIRKGDTVRMGEALGRWHDS